MADKRIALSGILAALGIAAVGFSFLRTCLRDVAAIFGLVLGVTAAALLILWLYAQYAGL
jgi:hypothetical protein